MKKRVVTPSVLQYEAVECGAASLKIVLGFYRRVVPLSELRETCGISRDGVTALQLKHAAESYGLNVRAIRCSAEDLEEHISCPSILHWNFNHFLVLEGFANERAFLSDPASGRRSIGWREFKESFTGVVLEATPGPDFLIGGNEPSLYHSTPFILKPLIPYLPWIALLSVFSAIPELFIAGASAQYIDSFLQEGKRNLALPIIWITAVSAMALVGFLNVQSIFLRRASKLLIKRIAYHMYTSLFSLPYTFFMQRMRGELSQRLQMPFSIVELGIQGIVSFLTSVGSGLIALLAGVLISPVLSVFVVLLAAANTGFSFWMRELRKSDNLRMALVGGKAMGAGIASIQCIESVKASGLENESFVQWSTSFTDSLSELQKQSLSTSAAGLISTTSSFLARTGLILIGGMLIIAGRLSLGELMAFQFLLSMIQSPLDQLQILTYQIQQLDGQFGRLNDILDTVIDHKVRSFSFSEHKTSTDLSRLTGEIRIENLSFQFAKHSPILFDGLDLSIQAGQHVAIVGGSGSGKSSLLRILAGLQEPTAGSILYDGRPWMSWNDDVLRASIALVSQDVFLFNTTLYENLTLWDSRFNRSDALEALSCVGLLDEIGGAVSLMNKIESGGRNLSGGQRQRVEIARALLRNPSILLMDEATSALDAQREKQIITLAKKVSRTLITVAHRLYSAQVSDLVLVLDKGNLVEYGNPRVLKSIPSSHYRRLLGSEALI